MSEIDEKAKAEVWKPVPGYEGLYEVSDFGRVRKLFAEGVSGVEIGRRFGVRDSTISRIKTGKLWKRLDAALDCQPKEGR
jgi:DNA invertase Pin-like site-specific DNA recombinase